MNEKKRQERGRREDKSKRRRSEKEMQKEKRMALRVDMKRNKVDLS